MSTAVAEKPATNNDVVKNEEARLRKQLEQNFQTVEYVPFGSTDKVTLSIELVANWIANKTKSGKTPTRSDCMKFIMLCKSRGLNPWDGDCYMIGYDGPKADDPPTYAIITAHQAVLKRAELNPDYDGMESGVIVLTDNGNGPMVDREGDLFLKTDHIIGGWATVYCKSRSHPTKRRLSLAVFSTGKSRWQADPGGMIVKCAEHDALRSTFPTKCAGMYGEGELRPWDVIGQPSQSREPPTGRVSLKAPKAQAEKPPEPKPGEGQTTEEYQPDPEHNPAEGEVPNDDEAAHNAAVSLSVKIDNATDAKTLASMESEITQANENGQIDLLWHDKLQAYRVERLKGLGKSTGRAGGK